jgi:hypothetical protein
LKTVVEGIHFVDKHSSIEVGLSDISYDRVNWIQNRVFFQAFLLKDEPLDFTMQDNSLNSKMIVFCSGEIIS